MIPTPERPPEIIALPLPQPIQMLSFKGDPFTILTPETIPINERYEDQREDIFEDMEWVFFGVTPSNYEVLSKNQAEVLRWITEAMWRLLYYSNEDAPDERRIPSID